MPALSTWNLDPTRILTRRELTTVLVTRDPSAVDEYPQSAFPNIGVSKIEGFNVRVQKPAKAHYAVRGTA